MVSCLDIPQMNPVTQHAKYIKHTALRTAVGLTREVDRFVMETRQRRILHKFDIAHISLLTHQIQNGGFLCVMFDLHLDFLQAKKSGDTS